VILGLCSLLNTSFQVVIAALPEGLVGELASLHNSCGRFLGRKGTQRSQKTSLLCDSCALSQPRFFLICLGLLQWCRGTQAAESAAFNGDQVPHRCGVSLAHAVQFQFQLPRNTDGNGVQTAAARWSRLTRVQHALRFNGHRSRVPHSC